MSENSAQIIWLTQEAYDKLKLELDHLSGPGRAAVSAKIAAAREEGDLSENGGYHAAFLVGALFAASAAAIGGIFLRTSAATAAYSAHDHDVHAAPAATTD